MMPSIDTGVIAAIQRYGTADEKAFAEDFLMASMSEREEMKVKYIRTWMHYVAMSIDIEEAK